MDEFFEFRAKMHSDFKGLDTRVRHLEVQVARLTGWVMAAAAGGAASATALLELLR